MYSLSEAEQIVSSALDISESDRSLLTSELKYLRRHGFPKLPKTGKGSRTNYTERDVFQLMVAVRIGQMRFPPKAAIQAAELASEAISAAKSLQPGPFLCFMAGDPKIISAEEAHTIVEERGAATLVGLEGLVEKFKATVERHLTDQKSQTRAPAQDFMNMVEYIWEKRDGDKR